MLKYSQDVTQKFQIRTEIIKKTICNQEGTESFLYIERGIGGKDRFFSFVHFSISFTENTSCQENADGRYPDPYNCCKFIHCFNGIPQRKFCPLGLMFNRTLKLCDWPEKVRCQG